VIESAEDRWDRRLTNWALWFVSGGNASYRNSLWDFAGRGRPASGDGVPALIGEAVDTDALVLMLERILRQSLIAWYVCSGTIAQRAGELSCHPNTLRYRVDCAKGRLEVMWQRRQAMRIRERAGLAR